MPVVRGGKVTSTSSVEFTGYPGFLESGERRSGEEVKHSSVLFFQRMVCGVLAPPFYIRKLFFAVWRLGVSFPAEPFSLLQTVKYSSEVLW